MCISYYFTPVMRVSETNAMKPRTCLTHHLIQHIKNPSAKKKKHVGEFLAKRNVGSVCIELKRASLENKNFEFVSVDMKLRLR